MFVELDYGFERESFQAMESLWARRTRHSIDWKSGKDTVDVQHRSQADMFETKMRRLGAGKPSPN